MSNWPNPDHNSMVAFYGQVGTNQGLMDIPYPLRLSWDMEVTVRRITCHHKVMESIAEAMQEIKDYYGYVRITELRLDIWGGCFNVRKMRGESDSWSKHSWGSANDWYPQLNGLHTTWNNSEFSLAEYVPFFNAWIRRGWNPLGLTWGFDAMHIEATNNGGLELIKYGDPRFREWESDWLTDNLADLSSYLA